MEEVLETIESCRDFLPKYEILAEGIWRIQPICYADEPRVPTLVAPPPAPTSAAAASTRSIEEQFSDLARRWKLETRNQSAISAIVMHPAYLDIIGLGPTMIPLILRELKRENNHWFTALRALAKTSPIKQEDAGNLKKMREAWLRWGRGNGYLD